MNKERQLIILIILTASLISFLGGYLLMQSPEKQAAVIQQQRGALIDRFSSLTPSDTPAPLPAGLLKASSDTALAPVNAPASDSVLYYHADNGYVSKLDLETRKNTLISMVALPNLANVIWSPDRNRVITVSQSGGALLYKYFDYTTRVNGSLGAGVKDAVFSPDSKRIAVARVSGDTTTIEVSDFGNTEAATVLKTRLTGIKIFWQSSRSLSFLANDTGTSTQSFYSLDLNGNLAQLLNGLSSIAVRWSPDGSQFIYSNKETGGTETYVFDTTATQAVQLPVQTEAGTCAWAVDQKSILCAVETEGETSIVSINAATNAMATLFSHLIITTRSIFLSHSENFLVLTSVGDQSLWAVKLGN